MYKWDAPVRVIYRDTDQMGVAYYGNYYAWFEIGRNEFVRSLGLTYRGLEEQGVMLPVIQSQCSYKVPAKYDDLILIRTGISELTGARVTFVYDIVRKEDEVLLAQGSTTHAFVDAGTLKPLNVKKRCAQYYSELKGCL